MSKSKIQRAHDAAASIRCALADSGLEEIVQEMDNALDAWEDMGTTPTILSAQFQEARGVIEDAVEEITQALDDVEGIE